MSASPSVRGFAIALGSMLAACVTAATPEPPTLRELIWTDPAADRAHVLTHEPGECIAARTPEIDAGRALFMSRTLLGGPAARIGLSCASCHVNGRANAHFLLPELTDRPGHADVTSEWSSKVRGDGVDNPVAIPDLAGVGAKAAFGQQREPSLRAFVHGVIVEEFQGPEPPAAAMEALLAYLRALELAACAEETPVSIALLIDDARRAFAAALNEPNAATSDLLILAAQDALARIVERLPPRAFARERRDLESLARDLGAARETGLARIALAWSARLDAVAARLEARAHATYASENVLRRALQQR